MVLETPDKKETPDRKDFWDKISALSPFIASILVPVVLALIGHAYTSALKQLENSVQYTEMAINILKEKPSEENNNVRSWAIDVVNRYSGVTMGQQAREQLLRSRLAPSSDMSNSVFDNSRFTGSSFTGSVFDNSQFDHSRFDGASFRNTSFRSVDLRGADLGNAIVDDTTRLPK